MTKQYRIYLDDFYLEELVVYKGSYRFVGELLIEYLTGNPDLQVPADLLDDDSFKNAFHQDTDFTSTGPALLTLDDGRFNVRYGREALESTYDNPTVESLYLLSVLDNHNHVPPHPIQVILKGYSSLDKSITFLDKQRTIGELLIDYLKNRFSLYTSVDLEDGKSYKKLFIDGTDFDKWGDVLLTFTDEGFTIDHIDFHNDYVKLRTENPDIQVATVYDIKTILDRQALK